MFIYSAILLTEVNNITFNESTFEIPQSYHLQVKCFNLMMKSFCSRKMDY